MLQTVPPVTSSLWNSNPSQRVVQKGSMEFKSPQLSSISPHNLLLKNITFNHKWREGSGAATSPAQPNLNFCLLQLFKLLTKIKIYWQHSYSLGVNTFRMLSQRVPGPSFVPVGRPLQDLSFKKQKAYPQNVDLPTLPPKKKKKPYPIPIEKIRQVAKKDKRLAEMGIEKPLEPPKNGILVPDLIHVAYEVIDAWKLLIKGLAQLLHVIPVYGCSECSEVHVAHSGHHIQNCQGATAAKRRSFHSWVRGSINDILLPVESYHLYDPFGRRIKHESRFDYDRIPAVVELCIQAGVDIPEYPSRRRTKPIRMLGKKVIDCGGFVEEPRPWRSRGSSALSDLDTDGACGRLPPPSLADVPRIAQETMDAYEVVRLGVTKLMRKYSVKACGYCPEVHIGPWGHNVKLCGAFKHQWRDGKHGWQDAVVDEVFPPNYVWHIQDPKGPPLRSALKRYYGKAPAVVEVCMQAGAQVPEQYKPTMRLDIIVPGSEEVDLVA